MFALLLQQGLPLGLRLADTGTNLLLNHLASRLEGLVEVFLLLVDLIAQACVLLLDALDEDVRKFAHVLEFRLDAL